MIKRYTISLYCIIGWLTLLLGCTTGIEYTTPSLKLPATFKAGQGWKAAQPADQQQRNPWWEAFGDPQLNTLHYELSINNQTIAQAEAQYRKSLALYAGAQATRYPTLTTTANLLRSNTTIVSSTDTASTQPYTLTFNAKWEIDLWGKIRHIVEAGHATVDASAAELAAARLSIQAQLTTTYLQWVVTQAQHKLLQQNVRSYQQQLMDTRRLFDAGFGLRSDILQAESQLKSTQAQAIAKELQRDQLHHALAMLIGKTPVELELKPVTTLPVAPAVPLIIPSMLLERRPDIAAAERQVAAANAQIGVAKAAYFPDVGLSASGGYNGTHWTQWFTVPGRFWSLGPELALVIMDGGARQAKQELAIAHYDKIVAAYRQTVLSAFQDVEDHLAATRALAEELQLRQQAWQATVATETLTGNQYRAGSIDALNVWVAEANRQHSEHKYYDTLSQCLAASVGLIRALGGDYWQGKTKP